MTENNTFSSWKAEGASFILEVAGDITMQCSVGEMIIQRPVVADLLSGEGEIFLLIFLLKGGAVFCKMGLVPGSLSL